MKKFWNLVNGEENTLHRQRVKTHYNVTSPQLKEVITFRFLQKSSLLILISFNLINKLLNMALTTGSAVLILSLRFFHLLGIKCNWLTSAVIDLDSSNEGPLSPKISPS